MNWLEWVAVFSLGMVFGGFIVAAFSVSGREQELEEQHEHLWPPESCRHPRYSGHGL